MPSQHRRSHERRVPHNRIETRPAPEPLADLKYLRELHLPVERPHPFLTFRQPLADRAQLADRLHVACLGPLV